jgi:hypothetical protein
MNQPVPRKAAQRMRLWRTAMVTRKGARAIAAPDWEILASDQG